MTPKGQTWQLWSEGVLQIVRVIRPCIRFMYTFLVAYLERLVKVSLRVKAFYMKLLNEAVRDICSLKLVGGVKVVHKVSVEVDFWRDLNLYR